MNILFTKQLRFVFNNLLKHAKDVAEISSADKLFQSLNVARRKELYASVLDLVGIKLACRLKL